MCVSVNEKTESESNMVVVRILIIILSFEISRKNHVLHSQEFRILALSRIDKSFLGATLY